MARQPIQVLVIPFRKHGSEFEYCLFRRSDDANWQFIAGGVEADETPLEAARRESFEEAGLPSSSKIIELDSMTCVPANIFRDWQSWPEGTYVVRELSFGIEASNQKIKISNEHSDCKWCSYEEAIANLQWDSNKTALWELTQRLKDL